MKPKSLTLAETHSRDLPLFGELGLNPFTTENEEEIYLGEYKLPGYKKASIEIWVTCTPAQFWRFEIIMEDKRKFQMETGSGSLKDYWPSALLIAKDLLTVTQKNKKQRNGRLKKDLKKWEKQ